MRSNTFSKTSYFFENHYKTNKLTNYDIKPLSHAVPEYVLAQHATVLKNTNLLGRTQPRIKKNVWISSLKTCTVAIARVHTSRYL